MQETRIWSGRSVAASGAIVRATKGVGITIRMTYKVDQKVQNKVNSARKDEVWKHGIRKEPGRLLAFRSLQSPSGSE